MANATELRQKQPTMAPGEAVSAPEMAPGFGNASLYVGDLEASVNEEQLFSLFNQVAQVVTVRVCRDQTAVRSLGYGYVNFNTPQDAALAMENLNFRPLNGKPMRIMFSQRDPSLRKSGYANVFIKNLDSSIDNRALFDTFSAFGTILSCKIAVNSSTGQSKGYGFVQFDKDEAAQNAIKSLNGMLLNDKQVYVGLFVRHQERYRGNQCPKFTNVFVKNLSETITDESLKEIFGPFGTITSCVVMKDVNGKSKCFGFVNFENPDCAEAAVEKLNGSSHDDKVLYVGRAQKKAEREADLRAKFEQAKISRFEKLQGANLYMKNLDDSIDDEKLKEMFSEFGTITSCKIMLDTKGASKGSGFVSFSTPEEATKAASHLSFIIYTKLTAMNGKMVGRKPLYVAVAQRKEERQARLQAHFAQLRAQAGLSPVSPRMPGFHPGATRMAPQQLYLGQGNSGLLSSQPTGYGFQHQIYRPGVAPNFMVPYLPRQGPHGQRPGLRHGPHAPKFLHQQQMANQSQGLRSTSNVRNGNDPIVVSQGLVGSVGPMPSEESALPVNLADNARAPMSSVLMSALRGASLDQQRSILGEHLYPLVGKIDTENVRKVTGMLLEMDQPEVLHLIESPEALKKKVEEALNVLDQAARSHAGEAADVTNGQLSSMPPAN
ncbi:hypothetical protein V2J09_017331 [Rumex salicifolius]